MQNWPRVNNFVGVVTQPGTAEKGHKLYSYGKLQKGWKSTVGRLCCHVCLQLQAELPRWLWCYHSSDLSLINACGTLGALAHCVTPIS